MRIMPIVRLPNRYAPDKQQVVVGKDVEQREQVAHLVAQFPLDYPAFPRKRQCAGFINGNQKHITFV